MKRILLLILTLLTLYIKSQTSTYHPFPSNYGNWLYRAYTDMGDPAPYYRQYTLSGDTIIANINYKKMSGLSNYVGGIRESAKVIYFVPDTSSHEYVLYDFNLGVGDTIIHPFGGAICSNDTVTILQVDSVQASDGYHRQLWLSSFAVWIEGIGSQNYLLEPAQDYCLSGNYRLECMTSDASFLYPSSSSSCVLSLSSVYKSNSDISILPNPSNGFLIIDASNVDIKEILITDVLGNTIIHEYIVNQDKIKVDNLIAGTYYLTLTDTDNRTHKTKIISSP